MAEKIIRADIQHICQYKQRGKGGFTRTLLVTLISSQFYFDRIRHSLLRQISLNSYLPKTLAKFHRNPRQIDLRPNCTL